MGEGLFFTILIFFDKVKAFIICNHKKSLHPKDNLFKNIFDFTTAGDWDCVAAVEHLPALHYSVDFIFLSFGIMGFIVEL